MCCLHPSLPLKTIVKKAIHTGQTECVLFLGRHMGDHWRWYFGSLNWRLGHSIPDVDAGQTPGVAHLCLQGLRRPPSSNFVAINQWFSILSACQSHLEGWFKHRALAPPPGPLLCLGWNQGICISSKFPDDVGVTGLRSTLGKLLSRTGLAGHHKPGLPMARVSPPCTQAISTALTDRHVISHSFLIPLLLHQVSTHA